MLFFVSPPPNSSVETEMEAVIPSPLEQERQKRVTRELHLLFGLPIPETLEEESESTHDPEKKSPWNHYLKSTKKKQVSWEDSKQMSFSTCSDTDEESPPLEYPYNLPPPPETWPQRPHFIRATPGSGTHIVGIRCADENPPWNEDSFWQEHPCVPINTGTEAPGQTIVADFVSKLFVGSVLFRMQGVKPCIDHKKHHSKTSYFDNKQRTYQVIVRGRFRTELPLTKCVTGQFFRRPAGTLPPHWAIRGIEAVVNRIQPNNELHVEGPFPRLLSPLITAAQTLQVKTPRISNHHSNNYNTNDDNGLFCHEGQFFYDSAYDSVNECYASNSIEEMEQEWEEPHATHHSSLIQQIDPAQAQNAPSTLDDHKKNQAFRKWLFNQYWAQQKQQQPDDKLSAHVFRTDREYTFEFYEHMINFNNPELALDLKVPLLHHIPVAPCTDGQPIYLMSAHRTGPDELEYLWNFEVWHESLYEFAVKAKQ